jgi:hypothetical protein
MLKKIEKFGIPREKSKKFDDFITITNKNKGPFRIKSLKLYFTDKKIVGLETEY